jgi:DNA-binding beta-propeller fold protein YncE
VNIKLVFPEAIGMVVYKACCLTFVLILVGCGTIKEFTKIDSPCEHQYPVDGAANLSVFFNVIRHDTTNNLNVKINSIELLVDDLWVPVSSDLTEVNSADAISIQRFVGRQWLKGRNCRGVRMKVAGVTLSRSTGDQVLSNDNAEVEVMLQNPLLLEADSRKVLLIEWDPEKSVSLAGFEGMALTAYEGGLARITANLAYVACPEIDTIYVVRTDKYQVVSAFAAKGKPTYLAVDIAGKKIHVLASALNKIISYDIYTHLPSLEIPIPMAHLPIFMTVNNPTQTAYVLDAQGVLTSIDLVSGNMLSRNRVGNGPNYLYYITGLEKLAVSSTYDKAVYLVNPGTLAVEDYISLGSTPLGLVSWGNYLYIAEGSANTVSLYDLSVRRMLKNIYVGFEPARLVTSYDFVFVTNYRDGSISVMPGGQYSVSKDVSVGKSAREMAVAEKQRLIFVGVGDCDGSLAVVDTTGNNVIGRIELGVKPMGISIIE